MKVLPTLIDISFIRLGQLDYREAAWVVSMLFWVAKTFHIAFIISTKQEDKRNYPVI